MIKRTLTNGPVSSILFQLSYPIFLGMLMSLIYDIINTIYVGSLGTEELSIIAFCFPIIMILNSISMGVGVSSSVIVSRIASDSIAKIESTISTILFFSGIFFSFLTLIFFLSIDHIFLILHVDSTLVPSSISYLKIRLLAYLISIIPAIISNILRATGDSFNSGLLMILSATSCLMFSPLLIFGYGSIKPLGLPGAAWSVLLSMIITSICALYILYSKFTYLSFRIMFKDALTLIKKLSKLALPISLSALIPFVSSSYVVRQFANINNDAVAAFGIIVRLELLILTIAFAISSTLTVFVAQNMAKGEISRVRKAMNSVILFSVFISVIIFTTFFLFGEPLIELFSKNLIIVSIVNKYFFIVSLSYPLNFIGIFTSAFFNGTESPILALYLSIIRSFVLYIPFLTIGFTWFHLHGMFLGILISNIIGGLVSYFNLPRKIRCFSR